jgi:hypothetical protein
LVGVVTDVKIFKTLEEVLCGCSAANTRLQSGLLKSFPSCFDLRKKLIWADRGGLGSAPRKVLILQTSLAEVSVKTKGLRDIAKKVVNRSSFMISLRVGAKKRV